MLPRRAFTVPASLILSFRTISVSLLKKPTIGNKSPPKPLGNAFVNEKYHEIKTGDNSKEQINEPERTCKSMMQQNPPHAPKYELTGFDFFVAEKLINSQADITMIADSRWERMTDDEKKAYADIAESRNRSGDEMDDLIIKITAYDLLVMEEETSSEAEVKWKGMSDDEKKAYAYRAEFINRSIESGVVLE